MPDRERELTALYAEEARSLERAVARSVVASHSVVEEACSYAWCQLVRRLDDIDIEPGVFWWLYRVAVRQVWRLTAQAGRCIPVGDPATVVAAAGLATQSAADAFEISSALDVLETLSERQRRILLMQAMGFSYAEIGRLTGDTVRTVERQLRRARQALAATRR